MGGPVGLKGTDGDEALRRGPQLHAEQEVDDVVVFTRLTHADLRAIVDLQVEVVRRRIEERGMALVVTDDARDLLAERGFDPVYGARPLKRYLQRAVETTLGRKIIAGEVTDGDTVRVDLGDEGLVFIKVEDADAPA